MSDGQAAFGVFFVADRRMLKTKGQLIRQCIYFMSHENISAIHSHSLGFGGLRLPPGMMWWGIDG